MVYVRIFACAFGEGRSNKHNDQQLGPATRTIFHRRGHAAVVFYGGLSPEKAISLSKYKFNWKGRGIIIMKGSFWGDYFYYLESPNFFPSAPHLLPQDNIYPIRRIFSLIKRDHNSAVLLVLVPCRLITAALTFILLSKLLSNGKAPLCRPSGARMPL